MGGLDMWSCLSVIFVAALSDYCETSDGENALHRTLDQFEKLQNDPKMEGYSIYVFLTKKDIFKQRLQHGIPLSVCFPNWMGPDYSPDNAEQDIDIVAERSIAFIWNQFLNRCNPQGNSRWADQPIHY